MKSTEEKEFAETEEKQQEKEDTKVLLEIQKTQQRQLQDLQKQVRRMSQNHNKDICIRI